MEDKPILITPIEVGLIRCVWVGEEEGAALVRAWDLNPALT